MMERAPGWLSGPLCTSVFIFSMLWMDTVSGNVMLQAMDRGTPTWSQLRYAHVSKEAAHSCQKRTHESQKRLTTRYRSIDLQG